MWKVFADLDHGAGFVDVSPNNIGTIFDFSESIRTAGFAFEPILFTRHCLLRVYLLKWLQSSCAVKAQVVSSSRPD